MQKRRARKEGFFEIAGLGSIKLNERSKIAVRKMNSPRNVFDSCKWQTLVKAKRDM